MADQEFIDALHEPDKIAQLVTDLNLAQYDNVVLTVNGKTGDVVLVTTDIDEGTNLYYTNTRADERVALLIDDALTNLVNAWSGQKITDAISAGVVASAAKWTAPMDYTFAGDLVGNGSFDGSTPTTATVTVPGKVNNSQVLTDVPAGALFTDTIYDDTAIQAEVDLNTAKVGITQTQADDITANNAKYTYPPEDAAKLLTMTPYANQNVQADWTETDDLQDSFIANRPPLTGRNILINGDFRVNQRGFNGDWGSIGNLAYGYDRWKKSDDGSKLVQVIEEGNYRPDTVYTLTGVNIVTDQITSPASGDWSVPVGDVAASPSFIQLEEGLVATPFEVVSMGQAVSLCQRYYEVLFFNSWSPAGIFKANDDTSTVSDTKHCVPKRVTPFVSIINAGDMELRQLSDNTTTTGHELGVQANGYSAYSLITINGSGLSTNYYYSILGGNDFSVVLSAEL